MNTSKIILATSALLGAVSAAAAGSHADAMKQVATYKPMAGFNHVVGDMRFVGYFLQGPDRCDVTVFEARAEDDRLTVPPRRLVLQIAAADRSELEAGPDSALAIACTVDADAIKIAPQTSRTHSAGL